MEAGKLNISGIFNRSRILKIPHFQRSYVWGEEQWERLLDDMVFASDFSNPYFMGSIILKQVEVSANQPIGDVRMIIDGQQRLTTFLLFFKALYEKRNEMDQFRNIFMTFDNRIILRHNYLDEEIFENILLDRSIDAKDKKKSIYKCYQYFKDMIDIEKINPISLLSNVLFVGIDLNVEEDEQQIFDTINSLGVSLTTAELLKNYLFKSDVQSYNENWRNVFEKNDEIKNYWNQEITSGGKTRSNLDIYLQSYLFIKIQDRNISVSAEDKLRFFKVESVFNSYKDFINKYGIDANEIISELKEYASIYKKIINPKIVKQDFDKNNYTDRLNIIIFGLDTAALIPYVLYIAKNVNDEEREKIYKYLEVYISRRIICRSSTKVYSQLFRNMLINNEINTFEKLSQFIDSKSDVMNNMPSDEDVSEGIKKSRISNRQARGLLYLVEKSIRNDMDACELRYLNEYSLEHVMPKKWKNKWSFSTLTEAQISARDKIILTLGNLTLITKQLNSAIRDADWQTKKNGSGRNKGLLEYAQGIKIFSNYLELGQWDESVIASRADELYSYAINEVWPINK